VTIKQALTQYQGIETDLLLAHILKQPKEFLFLHPEKELMTEQMRKFTNFAKRRLKGEPIAYILGYKYFYGLKFKVNKDVLIPRPETESLVEHAILFIKKSPQPVKVLDLGTGSGCIAISLAKNLPKRKVKIYASDISSKALVVAKTNARLHKANIKFIRSDLLEQLKNEDFDLIIANLPYGWAEWKNNSEAETIGLSYEPKQALFTGKQGLALIEKLLRQIKQMKKAPIVLLEFDPRQKAKLQAIAQKLLPPLKINFFKDYRGLWRYAEVVLRRSKSQ